MTKEYLFKGLFLSSLRAHYVFCRAKQSQTEIASSPPAAVPRNDESRAFTLIELLIAASISSVIILGLYSAFQTGILSREKIDASFQVYQSARITLNRIEQDVKNSYIYTDSDSGFSGDNSTLKFYAILDSFDRSGQPAANICRVEYLNDGPVLTRACYKGEDALRDQPQTSPEALNSQVKEIKFQYGFATQDPQIPYDWQNVWPDDADPQQKLSLPLAVKVSLGIGASSFIKIIPVPQGGEKTAPPPPQRGGGGGGGTAP